MTPSTDSRASDARAIDRRGFLAGAGAGVIVASTGLSARPAAAAAPLTENPFTLGIASGDATEDAIVLWTRLAPDPLGIGTGFGMGDRTTVEVTWRLAANADRLRSDDTSIAHGTVIADRETAFSAHVDVSALAPGERYVYQFRADGWASDIGLTRTAPRADADRRVRFAVINCQSLAGANRGFFFNGMHHIIARDDLDFVIFLGDYIYEFGRKDHIPPRPVKTLPEYRTRYGQYKLREELKELHRKFPIYAVPDDHEFFNDVTGGDLAPNEVPRFNRAMQVFWEHLPLRGGIPGPLSSTTANQPQLDRRIRWGAHLDLFLADVRTRRSRTSMVGPEQFGRLTDWLSTSPATWTVLGTGQPMTWFGSPGGWTAVPGERDRITDIMAERKLAAPATFNPVVLAGDAHCGFVSHLRHRNDHTSPLVATEFVNAPMTSLGTADWGPWKAPGAIRKAYNKPEAGWECYRGYLSCQVTGNHWTARYVIGDEVHLPDGKVEPAKAWRLRAGAEVGSIREDR